jgi:signal transduction histidine kinase
VIENLSEGLVVSDLNGQLLHWNRAAMEIHDFASIDECLLKLPEFANIFELSDLNGSLLELDEWPLPRIIRGEHLRNLEVGIRRVDGDWNRVYNYGGRIVQETSGRSVAIVTMSDITDRKLAEKEIRRLNEELEERVAERTAELQAVNKELEAFSYSVSHDLRAPLRHINGFSQALLEDYEDKLDETGKGYLNQVREASHEMAQLIDDVLQLARVTRTDMRREPINLSEIARKVIDDLRRGQEDRPVAIDIEEGLMAKGDKRLMQIVLSNLLGNAWKFTSRQEQTRIAFGQTKQNGQSSYFVRDNGAGFDMEYVGKLFGAFQRLHTVGEFEGTGIGLATVQRIVSRHGGRVWAEGKLNEGATFNFTLPISKELDNGEQGNPTS